MGLEIALGIAVGIGLPLQTSINSRLKKRMNSPFRALFISFIVSLAFLVAVLLLTGQSLNIPFEALFKEKPWIWLGGVCGVVFLTGNILLLPKLGSAQTAVLPVLGQILMGLLIDNFGWFNSAVTKLTPMRIMGAVLVFAGVVVITLAKTPSDRPQKKQTDKLKSTHRAASWVWKMFGIAAGMISAAQTAVNGHLGRTIGSPIKASYISFAVGAAVLAVVVFVDCIRNRQNYKHQKGQLNSPWWMWSGGILGAIYVLANVFLSGVLGTGLTVIVILMGTTAGGLLIDHFGWLGTRVSRLSFQKILGVVCMICGAVIIRLL